MFEWITGLGFRIADLGLRIWDFVSMPVKTNTR
jgi:hypothetical protein